MMTLESNSNGFDTYTVRKDVEKQSKLQASSVVLIPDNEEAAHVRNAQRVKYPPIRTVLFTSRVKPCIVT